MIDYGTLNISQTFGLIFHAAIGGNLDDPCAAISSAISHGDADEQQLNASEPDAEKSSSDSHINDQDDHDTPQEREDSDQEDELGGDDPGDEDTPDSEPPEQDIPSGSDDAPRSYWIIYRANPYNRHQQLYCYTETDVDNVAVRFQKALRRCWTCSSFHTPPLRFVHSSALLSQSARGAQQVAIVEYSQECRQFMSRHRTILAEVIVIFQSRWMLATSKAMFVERRGNFFQILRALQEIGECQQPDVICYGFQNGVYEPLRALIDVVDGDFLQAQILREDPPHPDARQLLDESPTPSVCSTCSASEELLRNPSKVLALRAYTFRGPGSSATTFYEEPLDDYEQYEAILSRVWRDLVDLDWQIVQVDDSFRSSTFLNRWNKIYLIDHERERHPGYSFVLFETNDPPMISQGKRLRATWIVPVVSREMIITLMEEHGRCNRDGTECFLVHNGRPVTIGETVRLRHGDYIYLDVNFEENSIHLFSVNPWRKENKKDHEWSKGHYFLLIILIDVFAAVLTFGLLCVTSVTCRRRLQNVGQRRYSIRGVRRRKYRGLFKAVVWSICLITADAMPALQFSGMHFGDTTGNDLQYGENEDQVPRIEVKNDSRLSIASGHDDHPFRLLSGYPGDDFSSMHVSVRLLSGYPDEHKWCGSIDGQGGHEVRSSTNLLPGYPGTCLRRYFGPHGKPNDVVENRNDGLAPDNRMLTPVTLPTLAFERQEMRQPRMNYANNYQVEELVDRYGQMSMGPIVLETFGLYDGPIGNRITTTNDLTTTAIRRAIHAAWIDYTAQYDSRIITVHPQPSHVPPPVKLFFIVQIVNLRLRLPGTWQPTLVDQQVESIAGATATTVRTAAYLNVPSNVEDVFTAARVGNSCLPNGIRPCAVIWRNRDWTYPSILQPIEGDYLIVTVDNLERYFSGTAGYFPGARRFALEGQRVYAQLSSGNHLSLWIHAIGHNYEPLGHRDAVLQMQDLLQPERVWNLAQHVWRDKRPGRAARLIPATPQPSIGSRGRLRLHLIFAFKIRLQYQPTLFVGMLIFDAAYTAFPQELQWTAVYTPTESNAPTMLSVSTLDYFRVVTRANYEITHRDDPFRQMRLRR